uniref:Uncharacterized protein n=1 Tax=Myripristis murdjan TaxID=586833 RepID=A0A667ZX12_9TELE
MTCFYNRVSQSSLFSQMHNIGNIYFFCLPHTLTHFISNVFYRHDREKMIKAAIPKEHPYSSHIPRFAMFPSFHSPDDPETGVRAASQHVLNPLIPASAPEVTVLRKTIGDPYRHEILVKPMTTRRKAVMWTGEHGFPVRKKGRVLHPGPPKIVFPNPKLRKWDVSLSERTANMLKNVERTHWLTSYQMDYTETSYPVFVPSKPREGRRRQNAYRDPIKPAEPLNPNPAAIPLPNQGSTPASIPECRPQEITAKHNETPDPNPKHHSQTKYSISFTKAEPAEVPREVLHKQQTDSKNSEDEISEKENCKVRFDETHREASMPQTSKKTNAAQATGAKIANTEHSLAFNNRPPSQVEAEVNKEKSPTELCCKDVQRSKKQDFKVGSNPFSLSRLALAKDQAVIGSDTEVLQRAALEQERLQKVNELPRSISNPCMLPRPPALPYTHPVGGERAALGRCFPSLRDLQDSFSESEVHRSFNSSIVGAAVDLRDNICMGRKHNFYGVNCSYLHG